MDMNTITYLRGSGSTGTPPYLTQGIYNKTLLNRAQYALLHQMFGLRKPLAQRSGTQMMFRRYEKLTKATTPLSEGTTPAGVRLTRTNITATILQYGNFTIIPDMAQLTEFDDQVNTAAEVMGENMGETIDEVHRGYLVAGTQFVRVYDDHTTYAGQVLGVGARTLVGGALCRKSVDYALRALRGENAKYFTPQIPASVKVNTFPIAKSFWCIIHEDQVNDIYNEGMGVFDVGSKFIPVEQYSNSTGVLENEVGKYRNARFISTTEAKVWADSGEEVVDGDDLVSTTGTNIDVYASLMFGRESYGIVPLNGSSARTIIHRAGGPGDPLDQRNSVGWKAATCSVILNDNFMFRIESGSYDGTSAIT